MLYNWLKGSDESEKTTDGLWFWNNQSEKFCRCKESVIQFGCSLWIDNEQGNRPICFLIRKNK